ncbi:hypothetical protein NEIPOLOT_00296 [Neisseria polysaccharea ATCC 43768]|nr:hypothetical protein NEIPOLOT_00296 [Neisseria polysaccharea ATCC 43768]
MNFNILFCLKLFSKSCIISVRFGCHNYVHQERGTKYPFIRMFQKLKEK